MKNKLSVLVFALLISNSQIGLSQTLNVPSQIIINEFKSPENVAHCMARLEFFRDFWNSRGEREKVMNADQTINSAWAPMRDTLIGGYHIKASEFDYEKTNFKINIIRRMQSNQLTPEKITGEMMDCAYKVTSIAMRFNSMK